jgi:hypothetical protein
VVGARFLKIIEAGQNAVSASDIGQGDRSGGAQVWPA